MNPGTLDSLGHFVCNITEKVTGFLPNSPITLTDLAEQLGDNIPFVGGYLVYKATSDIFLVLSLVVAWKTLKLLPGKFS